MGGAYSCDIIRSGKQLWGSVGEGSLVAAQTGKKGTPHVFWVGCSTLRRGWRINHTRLTLNQYVRYSSSITTINLSPVHVVYEQWWCRLRQPARLGHAPSGTSGGGQSSGEHAPACVYRDGLNWSTLNPPAASSPLRRRGSSFRCVWIFSG